MMNHTNQEIFQKLKISKAIISIEGIFPPTTKLTRPRSSRTVCTGGFDLEAAEHQALSGFAHPRVWGPYIGEAFCHHSSNGGRFGVSRISE